jgi:lipooligosaccharide transport system ATP-binding protein
MRKIMEKYVIEARDIHKSYGTVKAVDGLGFRIKASACQGFLGPNGAGKTTMMNMLYGRTQRNNPKKSRLNVYGFDPVRDELCIKYFSGVVPQENNLDEELDVQTNLWLYSRFYGMPAAAAHDRISELLRFMELGDKRKARIRELSGGMKRRLIIARALLNRPRLLILDEPTTGLDPQVRHLIWEKLRQLRAAGTTIILTTHYMEEAFQICDRIIIMDHGKNILEGEPKRLLSDSIEKFVLEVHDKRYARSRPVKNIRRDDTHDTVLLYSDDMNALRKISVKLGPTGSFLRPSNLEDLFLRKTGRELNDQQ